MSEAAPLLSVRGLTRRFSGVTALEDVSFDLHAGEIVGLIGPNGAGKTTLINLVTGIMPPSAGEVLLRGRSLAGVRPHRIARLGVARTFQHIRLFGHLSVLDNVMVGLDSGLKAGYLASLLGLARVRREEAAARERALALLARVAPQLVARADRPGSSLSYADKRRVEIARALALDPAVLLLDEPAAGMAPQEIHALGEDLKRLNGQGMAVVLIEHKMKLIEGVTDRVVVLDHGRKLVEGPFAEARRDPRVVEAYLGHAHAAAAQA
jgi:ABC-type branched-subunit amino acid transport system ATPase component